MAISMGRLTAEVRRVTLEFEGTADTLNIWYRPNDLSPKMQRRLREVQREAAERQRAIEAGERAAGGEEDEDETVRMLLSFVERWDLLESEESGAVLPVTAETLSGLGYFTLGRITAAVMEDIKPNPTRPRPSASGSAREASAEPVRIGSLSS